MVVIYIQPIPPGAGWVARRWTAAATWPASAPPAAASTRRSAMPVAWRAIHSTNSPRVRRTFLTGQAARRAPATVGAITATSLLTRWTTAPSGTRPSITPQPLHLTGARASVASSSLPVARQYQRRPTRQRRLASPQTRQQRLFSPPVPADPLGRPSRPVRPGLNEQ
jgi:hypothetical protein